VVELEEDEDFEDDLDTGRLAGCGVRGGVGVDVAVASDAACCEAPQEAQNLAPESISRPQDEQ
jgi:hypothetical protein